MAYLAFNSQTERNSVWKGISFQCTLFSLMPFCLFECLCESYQVLVISVVRVRRKKKKAFSFHWRKYARLLLCLLLLCGAETALTLASPLLDDTNLSTFFFWHIILFQIPFCHGELTWIWEGGTFWNLKFNILTE